MSAVFSELLVYVIKFVCMILCAAAGIGVGKHLRRKKNNKLANETAEQ
ncbi:MAG: hypothetical protein J5962_02025 [Lachnospiraceae bacterium]|nr:hypothetical protein [Lachnospiraceae bacterium]